LGPVQAAGSTWRREREFALRLGGGWDRVCSCSSKIMSGCYRGEKAESLAKEKREHGAEGDHLRRIPVETGRTGAVLGSETDYKRGS